MGYLEKAKKLVAKMEDQPEQMHIESERRLVAYSKVLSRNVVVSWKVSNPKVVYVNRIPYTTEEIIKLKGAGPKDVRAVHLTKETFNGEITDKG